MSDVKHPHAEAHAATHAATSAAAPAKRTPTPGVEKFTALSKSLTEANDKLKHMHAIRAGEFPDEEPVSDEEYHAQHYAVRAAETALQTARDEAAKT